VKPFSQPGALISQLKKILLETSVSFTDEDSRFCYSRHAQPY